MRRLQDLFGSQISQSLLEVLAALACGALLGLWISRISAGTPYPIAPRVGGTPIVAADPLDGIMTTATLFGSRRPGGPARNIVALGLIADSAGQGGAIVAVEGQPPRAVKVGDRIEGRLVTAIDAHGVTLEGSSERDTVPLLKKPAASLQGIAASTASPVGPVVAVPVTNPAVPGLLGEPLDGGTAPPALPPGYHPGPQQSPTGR
jgi:general secretion pathway protein C